jgi:hypothetical protein
MTFDQLEPSAHAPCTSKTFLTGGVVVDWADAAVNEPIAANKLTKVNVSSFESVMPLEMQRDGHCYIYESTRLCN